MGKSKKLTKMANEINCASCDKKFPRESAGYVVCVKHGKMEFWCDICLASYAAVGDDEHDLLEGGE